MRMRGTGPDREFSVRPGGQLSGKGSTAVGVFPGQETAVGVFPGQETAVGTLPGKGTAVGVFPGKETAVGTLPTKGTAPVRRSPAPTGDNIIHWLWDNQGRCSEIRPPPPNR